MFILLVNTFEFNDVFTEGNLMKKTQSKTSEVPKSPPKPIIEEISLNYYLEFQNGDIYKGMNILRAVCVKHHKWLEDTIEKETREIVNVIDGKAVNCGYGHTLDDAIRDFITRNSNGILDVMFESSLVKI